MRRSVIAAVVLLSGCSPQKHRYMVETREAVATVVSADVSVCRQPTWPLKRSGTRFTGTKIADCEGSGYIRLRHQDGTMIDCQVGYVTTSLDQIQEFVVNIRSCEPAKSTMRAAVSN